MSGYTAPLDDMTFLLKDVFNADQLCHLEGYEDATLDTMDAILEEAAKFGRDVIAPLAQPSDKQGAQWHDKTVTTSPGYKEAYAQFIEGGWNGVSATPDHGGMGLPLAGPRRPLNIMAVTPRKKLISITSLPAHGPAP